MSGTVEQKAPDSIPVRKIKKFRAAARPAAVLRLARAQSGNAEAALTETALAPLLEKAHALAVPAAAYSTLKGVPSFYAPVEHADPRIPFSYSLMAVTIGDQVDQEAQQAILSGREKDAQLYSFIEQVLLNEAAQFVWRLVQEEANLEGFEITPRLPAQASLTALKDLNSAPWEKIGIQIENETNLLPKASRIDYSVWLAKGKRRR